MLYWYSSAAPLEPPEPDVIVTVPVLNPAHTVLPEAGVAVFKAGDVKDPDKVQVLTVLQPVVVQP